MEKGNDIMAAGDLIISFRPEVQQMILSNQDKFNPDKNGVIDATEIGVLLKEFGAKQVSELQHNGAFAMADTANDAKSQINHGSKDGFSIKKALFAAAAGLGTVLLCGKVSDKLIKNGFKMPKGKAALLALLGAAVIGFVEKKLGNVVNNEKTNSKNEKKYEQDTIMQTEHRVC